MKRRDFLRKSASLSALATIHLSEACSLFLKDLPADIISLNAVDLSLAIRNKTLSCFEVMKAYLKHIHTYNPTYNAIVSMEEDEILLKRAFQADTALAKGDYWGWMHGMPHAIKDLAPVKDMIFTSGSPMFTDRIADEDGELVKKIRNQGALFIGKTNTPEFGLGSQTYNPVFGATGSAYNPELTSGGSSGGAACGLGTQMLPAAEGGDMMGSLRNPGAFNNVIGFRPSTTVVMSEGDEKERLLWTSGPMGRNTRDLIQLLNTLAHKPEFQNIIPLDFQNLKIGWLKDLDGYLSFESGILELCENSLSKLVTAGAKVELVNPDFLPSDLWTCWTTLRHHTRFQMMEYYENPKTRDLLKPELIWEIEQALKLEEKQVSDAKRIRQVLYVELDRLFKKYDFLILPTAQVFPFSKETHWPKQIGNRSMDTYHRWMEVVILGSLGGIPVINLPTGFDAQGRPMGIQVMSKFGKDRNVLAFALAYEQVTDYLDKRPKLFATKG